MFARIPLNRHLLIIPSLLLSCTAQAQMYAADMASSEWKTLSTPFSCSLTHTIPAFGKAVFTRKASSGERFYLEAQAKISFPQGTAKAETLPPVWRSDLAPVSLGSFDAVAGNQPVNLDATQITPVVAQLTAGMNVMYSSQPVANASSGSSIMRVVLTAKNFAEGYKVYQKCVADIIPYGYAQVARTSIHYAEKPEALTASQKADLGRVARYVKADPKVVGVFVDGHSDTLLSPEAGEAQSRQLAEWVSAYLVDKGVAESKITTRWHGDKFLIANNKTAAGRAQNRRVTVRLEDETAHKEFMKKEEEKRKAEEKSNAEKAVTEKIAGDKTARDSTASSSASSSRKMTPEEISRMVEGFDLAHPK